jgi:hypothetical protein
MAAVLGTLEHYTPGERKALSNLTFAIARWFGEIFGCQHRQMSRPFSRHGETYRVCISCGARRAFDQKTWNSSGRHYYKPARTSELRDINTNALRCVSPGQFVRAGH